MFVSSLLQQQKREQNQLKGITLERPHAIPERPKVEELKNKQ